MKVTLLLTLCLGAASLIAAPVDRVTRPVDTHEITSIPGYLHRLAQPQFDQGPVDAAMPMKVNVQVQ